jgi:hypothetical protein
VSEAFAGLDRIREIREMATEDQADATKQAMRDVDGRVEFPRRNPRPHQGSGNLVRLPDQQSGLSHLRDFTR